MTTKDKQQKGFSLMFGKNGWIKGAIDMYSGKMSEYKCLIITSKGVYFNGEKIAKGKLELIKETNPSK